MSDHHVQHAQHARPRAREGPRHLTDGPSVITVQQEGPTDERGGHRSERLGGLWRAGVQQSWVSCGVGWGGMRYKLSRQLCRAGPGDQEKSSLSASTAVLSTATITTGWWGCGVSCNSPTLQLSYNSPTLQLQLNFLIFQNEKKIWLCLIGIRQRVLQPAPWGG